MSESGYESDKQGSAVGFERIHRWVYPLLYFDRGFSPAAAISAAYPIDAVARSLACSSANNKYQIGQNDTETTVDTGGSNISCFDEAISCFAQCSAKNASSDVFYRTDRWTRSIVEVVQPCLRLLVFIRLVTGVKTPGYESVVPPAHFFIEPHLFSSTENFPAHNTAQNLP